MLARASYYKHVSLGPQDLDRSLGRHVRPYTETRQPIRPKDPAVPRGGECYKAYPGLGNRSIFYPGSSVGSTITRTITEIEINLRLICRYPYHFSKQQQPTGIRVKWELETSYYILRSIRVALYQSITMRRRKYDTCRGINVWLLIGSKLAKNN